MSLKEAENAIRNQPIEHLGGDGHIEGEGNKKFWVTSRGRFPLTLEAALEEGADLDISNPSYFRDGSGEW